MTITEDKGFYKEYFALEGKLDTKAAMELEKTLQAISPVVKEVILDIGKLSYISSMGLRAILQTYKKLKMRRGKLSIVNIPDNIRSIFEMSGFIQAFVQEEKFVVIEKDRLDNSVNYFLAGVIDANAAIKLDIISGVVKNEGIKSVNLVCEEIKSVTKEGCLAINELKTLIDSTGGVLTIENLSLAVIDEMKQNGLDAFLKEVMITTNKPQSEGNEVEKLKFEGGWGSFVLPQFDVEWKNAHKNTKNVIINLKGVSDMSPDAFNVLMALKKKGAAISVAVDLEL